jgi:serine/threonine protein kinase
LRGQEPDAEAEYRLRFLNEAKAAGRLHHPGIVSVFDVGEEPEHNDPYIVLELVDGEALNRMLKREKKLPLDQALRFVAEIAEALDYAHAQGVVHRDIKPGNILITPDGHPKIADFGIAKLNLAHFTIPGKVLGTPAYMAPEQLAGEGADGRSDLFSLGVILYAMVAGHSPFQGDSATTVCFKVANREPIPASALDLSLPAELDAVIARAMAKDPKQRYQRGAELAEAVRQLQGQSQKNSTTTSFVTALGNSPRKPAQTQTQTQGLNRRPATGLAYAVKFIRAEFLKAPGRDLLLGVATIILLLIVGVQSKLLFNTHEEAVDPAQLQPQPIPQPPSRPLPATTAVAAPAATNANADSSAKNTLAASSPAAENPAPKPAVRKASTKAVKGTMATVPPPAKQIVVSLSTVELAIRHQFKDATLTVWIDDQLALTRPLHGGSQKRLVVFNGVRGIESETLKVPAGRHMLRFRTQSADQTTDLSKTIAADFIGGNDRTLQISFDKHNASMHLDWQ